MKRRERRHSSPCRRLLSFRKTKCMKRSNGTTMVILSLAAAGLTASFLASKKGKMVTKNWKKTILRTKAEAERLAEEARERMAALCSQTANGFEDEITAAANSLTEAEIE